MISTPSLMLYWEEQGDVISCHWCWLLPDIFKYLIQELELSKAFKSNAPLTSNNYRCQVTSCVRQRDVTLEKCQAILLYFYCLVVLLEKEIVSKKEMIKSRQISKNIYKWVRRLSKNKPHTTLGHGELKSVFNFLIAL